MKPLIRHTFEPITQTMKKLHFTLAVFALASLTLVAQNQNNFNNPQKTIPAKNPKVEVNQKTTETKVEKCEETVQEKSQKPSQTPIIGGFLGFLLFEPHFLSPTTEYLPNTNTQSPHLERGNS